MKVMKKPFLIIAGIYILGIMAILRANFNYIDDIGRVLQGYKGWENNSRYASNFFSGIVHADNYLTDISPLSQIIAAMIMAFAGIIVIRIFSKKDKLSFWNYVAVVPLALSPYFLECFSYKFDAPYMALSVLASIFPLLFSKKGNIGYLLLSIIGILLVCTTYQPATGIFPMLVMLISLKRWNEKENIKEVLKFIGISVLGYGIGLVFFKLFIMQPVDNYVSNTIALNGNFIVDTINRLKEYFMFIQTDFKREWLILIIILCISFIVVSVRDSKQKRFYALVVSLITIVLMTLLIFGIYPFFGKSTLCSKSNVRSGGIYYIYYVIYN